MIIFFFFFQRETIDIVLDFTLLQWKCRERADIYNVYPSGNKHRAKDSRQDVCTKSPLDKCKLDFEYTNNNKAKKQNVEKLL